METHDANDFADEVLRVRVRDEQRHDVLRRGGAEQREEGEGGS